MRFSIKRVIKFKCSWNHSGQVDVPASYTNWFSNEDVVVLIVISIFSKIGGYTFV